jgi:hypothetical protein
VKAPLETTSGAATADELEDFSDSNELKRVNES